MDTIHVEHLQRSQERREYVVVERAVVEPVEAARRLTTPGVGEFWRLRPPADVADRQRYAAEQESILAVQRKR